MLKVSRVYRGKKNVIAESESPSISISNEGEIVFELWNRDGRASAIEVVMSPVELKRVRDTCNQALSKITGLKYTTQIH